MRPIAEFALLFVAFAFVQAQLVVPKFDHLEDTLSSIEFEQFISVDQAQELRSEMLATLLTAFVEHWNVLDVAQALERLATENVPQINQMHLEYD